MNHNSHRSEFFINVIFMEKYAVVIHIVNRNFNKYCEKTLPF